METAVGDDSKYDQDKEELESDEVPKPVLAEGELLRKAPRLSDLELEAFYQSSESVSGKPDFTENPMLDTSENMEEKKVNESEYMKVMEANDKMKCDIVELRSENEAVRSEIEAVRSDNEAMRSENEALRSEIERLRGDAHSKNNQGITNG
jgi:FtsZ-binding cell division protein ZapB